MLRYIWKAIPKEEYERLKSLGKKVRKEPVTDPGTQGVRAGNRNVSPENIRYVYYKSAGVEVIGSEDGR